MQKALNWTGDPGDQWLSLNNNILKWISIILPNIHFGINPEYPVRQQWKDIVLMKRLPGWSVLSNSSLIISHHKSFPLPNVMESSEAKCSFNVLTQLCSSIRVCVSYIYTLIALGMQEKPWNEVWAGPSWCGDNLAMFGEKKSCWSVFW